MSKFLVTGGAGFIGSHIVEKLLQDGHQVRILDNFSSGKRSNLNFVNKLRAKNYKLIKGDIRDYKSCLASCKGVDYVLHQAALRSVPKSLVDPHSYNDVNITGTLNMLKAAYESKVKRFVFASSSSIYGDASLFPEKESDMPLLISPYALSKLAGEYYCRIFSEIYGLETVSLRYFNVFGPRQALDDDYAVVIPKFISCMLENKRPPIFGNGKQSRDFTYVENVARANILSATKPGIKCAVLNIASGSDKTILELVSVLNGIMNNKIKPQLLPKRAGDVFKTLADISQAKKTIGYKVAVDFKQGLLRTVEYFKSVK